MNIILNQSLLGLFITVILLQYFKDHVDMLLCYVNSSELTLQLNMSFHADLTLTNRNNFASKLVCYTLTQRESIARIAQHTFSKKPFFNYTIKYFLVR